MALVSTIEHAFTMVKPPHIDQALLIFDKLDTKGKRVTWNMVFGVPLALIEEHYAKHRGKPYFGYMTRSFEGKTVAVAVYSGKNVIHDLRELVGPTDPSKAGPETIRGMYSRDSLEVAIKEERPCDTVAHCSDSLSEAIREIHVWAEYLPHLRA